MIDGQRLEKLTQKRGKEKNRIAMVKVKVVEELRSRGHRGSEGRRGKEDGGSCG